MRGNKKISLWVATVLFVLSFGLWVYYVSFYMKHIYTLVHCSEGQVAFIPKRLCQTYLFGFRGTQDDVSMINYDGSLPGIIASASEEDQAKLLEFLLEKGVDINGLDRRVGVSPLHGAVSDNDLQVAELLLRYGANPSIRDKKHNLTPLERALQLQDRPGQPDRTAIIKLLEQYAAKS